MRIHVHISVNYPFRAAKVRIISQTARFSFTFIHTRTGAYETHISYLYKRSIRMSDAPFSFALSLGVTLRHLVHILTHVGDVTLIGARVGSSK